MCSIIFNLLGASLKSIPLIAKVSRLAFFLIKRNLRIRVFVKQLVKGLSLREMVGRLMLN